MSTFQTSPFRSKVPQRRSSLRASADRRIKTSAASLSNAYFHTPLSFTSFACSRVSWLGGRWNPACVVQARLSIISRLAQLEQHSASETLIISAVALLLLLRKYFVSLCASAIRRRHIDSSKTYEHAVHTSQWTHVRSWCFKQRAALRTSLPVVSGRWHLDRRFTILSALFS